MAKSWVFPQGDANMSTDGKSMQGWFGGNTAGSFLSQLCQWGESMVSPLGQTCVGPKKKKSHQNSSIFGIGIAFFTLIFARVMITANICTGLFSFLSSGVFGVPKEVWDKAKEVWSEYSFHIKFSGLKGSRACLAPFLMN